MLVTLASLAVLATAAYSGSQRVLPPAPYGALPSPRQIEHAQLENFAFLHFTVNTFTDREWGHGDEEPDVFDPEHFDPDQMVMALKAAGMKGAIITAKHHDGFCLWPTHTTDHSVARSKWMGGKGDVVGALAAACKRHGLKFGVYLSPWDRNNAHYGKPEYVDIYRAQLKELLTHYGPIFEVWHDGANGGDGYYGGARETRSIDRRTYYGWPTTWEMVRKLQPGANIFSDVGPDLRWVGNESGYAAETSWATYDPVGEKGDAAAPGYTRSNEGETGHRDAKHWLPAECDVSIRPGWFWHAAEDSHVKSPAQLVDLYYKSVGRGASFLLNVPPNRDGRFSDADVDNLKRFGEIIRDTFHHNLASNATCVATNVRGGASTYAAKNLLSTDMRHYYASDDAERTPSVELQLKRSATFNVIRLREAIQLGQRVDSVEIEAWQDGRWTSVATATSIGTCRLIRLEKPVTTDRVRLKVTEAKACPALYAFGLFMQPTRPS